MSEREDIQGVNGSAQAVGSLASQETVKHMQQTVLHNQRVQVANVHLQEGERHINQLGLQFGAQSDAQLGGRVAEAAHCATFNADAAMKGRFDLTARTTAQVGRGHDVADIEILKSGDIIGRAQLKYSKNGEKTAKALSYPKYRALQKVGPADQLDDIRAVARKEQLRNLETRPEQAAHYEDTAQVASDSVKAEGVKSKPLTLKGDRSLAKASRQGRSKLGRVPRRSVTAQVGRAAGNAALAGGVAAGGLTALVSGASNAAAAFRGEMSGAEAAKRTAVDTSLAALEGGAKAATGAALKAGAAVATKSVANQAVRSALGSVARSNGVFAAGSVVVDAVVGGVNLAAGKIDGAEYAKRVGASASGAAGGWGGAAGGAALGTLVFPGVGTTVGVIIGGIGGAIGATSLFKKIFGK